MYGCIDYLRQKSPLPILVADLRDIRIVFERDTYANLHSIFQSLSCTCSLILAPCRIEFISHGEGNLGCRVLVIYQFFQLAILANGMVVIGAK